MVCFRRRHAVQALLAVLHISLVVCRRPRQGRSLSDAPGHLDGCQHHDQLYSQVHKDLQLWHEVGLISSNAPDYNKLCEPKSLPCYFITLLIENGVPYLTSFFEEGGIVQDGVVKSTEPGRAGDAYTASGFLLELYQATLPGGLPDGEFALYWGDDHNTLSGLYYLRRSYPSRPDVNNTDAALPVMLTFSKRDDEPYVLMPFSAHQRCSVDNIDFLMSRRAQLPNVSWDERTPVAFGGWSVFCAYWQSGSTFSTGQPMGCARKELLTLSQQHPDVINVTDGQMTPRPFVEHFRYKYAVVTDGWTASSRLEKVMLTGAAVLKQASPRYAYFYSHLHEYEHYVPFWRDNASDILQAVQWLREHDEDARRIGENAHTFVRRHLARPARVCYWRHLLRGIGRLTKYTPVPCAQRPVCVPLGRQLSFMGHFLGCSPYSTIHQQLDRMHGRPLDHGNVTDKAWGMPRAGGQEEGLRTAR